MLDESIKRFLLSEFGVKLLLKTKLMGKDIFTYGKKSYSVDKLLKDAEILKSQFGKPE